MALLRAPKMMDVSQRTLDNTVLTLIYIYIYIYQSLAAAAVHTRIYSDVYMPISISLGHQTRWMIVAGSDR